MTAEPTPRQRFEAARVRWALAARYAELNHHEQTLLAALHQAAYFDGFPHTYTPYQVTAGRALITSVATRDGQQALHALRVRLVT